MDHRSNFSEYDALDISVCNIMRKMLSDTSFNIDFITFLARMHTLQHLNKASRHLGSVEHE